MTLDRNPPPRKLDNRRDRRPMSLGGPFLTFVRSIWPRAARGCSRARRPGRRARTCRGTRMGSRAGSRAPRASARARRPSRAPERALGDLGRGPRSRCFPSRESCRHHSASCSDIVHVASFASNCSSASGRSREGVGPDPGIISRRKIGRASRSIGVSAKNDADSYLARWRRDLRLRNASRSEQKRAREALSQDALSQDANDRLWQ